MQLDELDDDDDLSLFLMDPLAPSQPRTYPQAADQHAADEEARRKLEMSLFLFTLREGRGEREEGRWKMEEGRGKREEGRGQRAEGKGLMIEDGAIVYCKG